MEVSQTLHDVWPSPALVHYIHTRCVIITGSPKFQGQNLINKSGLFTQKFPDQGTRSCCMKCYQIIHHMYCLYSATSLSTWRHCELLPSVLLIPQWDSGAHACARVSRRKADTFNTNLASSFRPLLRTHLFMAALRSRCGHYIFALGLLLYGRPME